MRTAEVVDSNIIIDFFRNYKPAVDYIKMAQQPFLMSVITVAELFAGVRNNHEKKTVEDFLIDFKIIPVDKNIAEIGGAIREKYGKSHGTCLPDSLIAATVLHHEATLVTLNTRHFPMVKTVKPYKK